MIGRENLITEVKYFGAKINQDFMLIGYVDVKHDESLVFHADLTQRAIEQVNGMTADEIQQLAQTEANEILQGENAEKCINDYVTLYNLGLYGSVV